MVYVRMIQCHCVLRRQLRLRLRLRYNCFLATSSDVLPLLGHHLAQVADGETDGEIDRLGELDEEEVESRARGEEEERSSGLHDKELASSRRIERVLCTYLGQGECHGHASSAFVRDGRQLEVEPRQKEDSHKDSSEDDDEGDVGPQTDDEDGEEGCVPNHEVDAETPANAR
jgi:hypothetical protein